MSPRLVIMAFIDLYLCLFPSGFLTVWAGCLVSSSLLPFLFTAATDGLSFFLFYERPKFLGGFSSKGILHIYWTYRNIFPRF